MSTVAIINKELKNLKFKVDILIAEYQILDKSSTVRIDLIREIIELNKIIIQKRFELIELLKK